MKLKYQLISNTLFGISKLLFSRAIGFILTPYVLYKLGIENFAVWSLMRAMLSYFTRADMGVSTSYVKFLSQFHAKKEYESFNKVINSGFVYYALLGAIIYTIVHFWGQSLFSLFQIDEALQMEASRLFRYVVLFSVCNMSLNVFSSVLWGIQRSDIVSKVQMGIFAVEAVCKVVFLELGYTLEALVWTTGITTALKLIVFIFLAYSFVPKLRFNPFLFDLKMFRHMFGYGFQLQISRFAKISQMHLSKLFLAYFLPLSAVTIYDIGGRIASAVKSFPLMLIPSILPAASKVHTLQDTEMLNSLYHRASKYVAISVFGVSGFFLSMMPVVILSWLGDQIDIGNVSIVARILIIGMSYGLLSQVASNIVLGMGHPEYTLRASGINLFTNIVLNFSLIPLLGFVGAALANTTARVIAVSYLVIMCHKKLNKPYVTMIKKLYMWPAIGGITASFNGFFLYKMICYGLFIPQGRFQNISVLLLSGGIFAISYGVILLKSGYIDRYDRDLFLQYFPKLGGFMSFFKRDSLLHMFKAK